MKRYIVFFAALATVAVLFTGCGGADNVSDNPDGMIESSTQTTEKSARATVPTESTRNNSMFGAEETGTDATEATTEAAPSARGRNPRRF